MFKNEETGLLPIGRFLSVRFPNKCFIIFSPPSFLNFQNIQALKTTGLRKSDPRLKEMMENLKVLQKSNADGASVDTQKLDLETFNRYLHFLEKRQINNVCIKICFSIISKNIGIISRAFRHQFIIPEFQDFANVIDEIYWKCKDTTTGKVNKNNLQLRSRRIMRSSILLAPSSGITNPFLSTGCKLYPAIGKGESGLLGHKRVHNRRPEVLNRRCQRAVHPAVVQQAPDVRICSGPVGSEPGPPVCRPGAQRKELQRAGFGPRQ